MLQHPVIQTFNEFLPMTEKLEKGKSLVPLQVFIKEQGTLISITAISDRTAVGFYQKTNTPIVYQRSDTVASTPCSKRFHTGYGWLPTTVNMFLLLLKIAYFVEKIWRYISRND